MGKIRFLDNDGTFRLDHPEDYHYLYFPIAGEKGLKSAVTPTLGGDSKLAQETFLLEPVSSENLHNNRSTRNFWCLVEGKGFWSAAGASAQAESRIFSDEKDESEITAGLMWQTICRKSKTVGLESEITSFVPVDENVEIMHVKLRNITGETLKVTSIPAIPIYGRSADNIRDHRNVTSMLHRIRTTRTGVLVKPTMSFDERGHQINHLTYFVTAVTGSGENPAGFYPTVDSFLGHAGTFTQPEAVCKNTEGVPAGFTGAGREAVGAARFTQTELAPGQETTYIVLLGVTDEREGVSEEETVKEIQVRFDTDEKVQAALERVKTYWQEKINVRYYTGNPEFDNFLRWVSFQPHLRRLYGCSFLPHHDYGRGGRGWRDLWQDCLSLLIMDPGDVRGMIRDNFGGVRIDGTNATIIGHGQGNFIADRNGISRVWMDHAVWPLITTKFYIDQTGDLGILLEKVPYFKDTQAVRGTANDEEWDAGYGTKLRTGDGGIYTGTILEHLLVQHLAAFYEVGAHNIIRLRGADWNDALDMAAENGESVAFTCAYAGNLRQIAGLLKLLKERERITSVKLLKELDALLEDEEALYQDPAAKNALLETYCRQVIHNIGTENSEWDIDTLAENLLHKADWMTGHLRGQEWQTVGENGWYNSYYDDHKRRVDGGHENGVRMMLTGQVFAAMSGTATEEQVKKITEAADRYLYEKEIGGYRLNTDFRELKSDMGRMFGFAYGEKENGAVFSHMTVMYANALYRRGFAKEGYKALQTLADAAMNFETSQIYPGVPEYFNNDGKGLYHYLTGAASWYMMTMIVEVFGVRGEVGDLAVRPRLIPEQFDADGKAALELVFAGRSFTVEIQNPKKLAPGDYRILQADCDGRELATEEGEAAVLKRGELEKLNTEVHKIRIMLG